MEDQPVAPAEQVADTAVGPAADAGPADHDAVGPRLIDRTVWLVAGVAAALRLVWVLIATREPKGLADPALYLQFARRIADGDGYASFYGEPTSYYPPGYPLFLGGWQWVLDRIGLGDHMVTGTALIQVALGAVAAGAVVVVGRRLGGARVALVAGLVLACWPNLVVYSSLALSETLFLALFTVSLAAALTMADDAPGGRPVRVGRAVVAGLTLGGATLVRPQVLLIVPALVLAWALGRIGWRAVLVRTGVLIVGVVLLVVPWSVRNYAVFDHLVPISTNGGDNLCVGFHPGAPGHFTIPAYCDTGEFYVEGPGPEYRRDRETAARAREWILDHPGSLPLLSLRKLWYTYSSDSDGLWASESFGQDRWLGGARTPLKVVMTVPYLLIMAAAVGGLVLVAVRGWRDRRVDPTGLAVVLVTLAGFVVPVFFFGDARFKVPVTPCYAVLAAVAGVALWDRLRPRPSP